MTSSSWWVGLTDAEFTRRAAEELARMAHAKGVTYHARGTLPEPRPKRPTDYTYHLEAERVEP